MGSCYKRANNCFLFQKGHIALIRYNFHQCRLHDTPVPACGRLVEPCLLELRSLNKLKDFQNFALHTSENVFARKKLAKDSHKKPSPASCGHEAACMRRSGARVKLVVGKLKERREGETLSARLPVRTPSPVPCTMASV